MKSKLKIKKFGRYCHTLNSSGNYIYLYEHGHRHRTPVYDAVGANYEVVLDKEEICW